ncbi:Hypothetical protein GLP15_1057 [Giardia lamblia P15]|uniref:Uncharacterized protein n=1 Tax=Giardia intestinalis (strain P15) TaxID=658858 RepID=E1F2Y0_GIAIA|nr:Hypothetical protein GLP15_1057 [Giardia lamblia P15]
MLQQIEHILGTHADAFTECQHACKHLHASYVAHYAAATPSAITAITSAYPGHALVVAGTRRGTVHALSLNSPASTLILPSFTEPGMLAPAPVSDLVSLGRYTLAARGYMLTTCCMDSLQAQNVPLHTSISSLSTAPGDQNTVLLGFTNGTFGWLDLRSDKLQLHEINRFGSLSTRIHSLGSVPKIEPCLNNSKVCVKQHTETSKQVFISVEKPGAPARIWDTRSTSSFCNLIEPSVENGRILWGEFNKTHIAVLSSNDAVFFYNHRNNYALEYYSCITTRHSARSVWIDDCRLITGSYSRMRETDQRGFPIIAVPERLEDGTEPLKEMPVELAYEWINCPFQYGTSALYPFSSRSLPTLNTFYGVAMDDSICVLDERPWNPVAQTQGSEENYYGSGFKYCSNKPLGLPKDPSNQDRDASSNNKLDGYSINVSNSVDWALKRWGIPISTQLSNSRSFSAYILDNLSSRTSMTFSTPTLSSSLSQSDKLGVSQDGHRRHRWNEYACYSYSSTCCLSQLTQEKEPLSTSPPLKLDQSGPRHFIPWQLQSGEECPQKECLEVDSFFEEENPDCVQQSVCEINFDDS